MQSFTILTKTKKTILALGPESAGNFSVFHKGKIHFSQDFGDLLNENNFKKFKKSVLAFLKTNKIKPNIIAADLHPLYKTAILGEELAKKFKAKHIKVQHHLAHIFSAFGENILNSKFSILNSFVGIACDGTGYGLDEKIWGGEVFQFRLPRQQTGVMRYALCVMRVGHLENQIMIGGDLAVREPARMLISILNRIGNLEFGIENNDKKKNFIFQFIKKHYNKNQFELLYNQLQQNFNCQETSSTGRVLDAVSVLLGFAGNKRSYKHEPIDLLEQNSTIPYNNIKPTIKRIKNKELGIMNYELCTTPLFEYLIRNIHQDKKRLASTAQLYIAQGLYEIIKNIPNSKFTIHNSYLSGGIANNKIISTYLESKGVNISVNPRSHPRKSAQTKLKNTNYNLNFNKKVLSQNSGVKKIPRGDAGLSFGQVVYCLLGLHSPNGAKRSDAMEP